MNAKPQYSVSLETAAVGAFIRRRRWIHNGYFYYDVREDAFKMKFSHLTNRIFMFRRRQRVDDKRRQQAMLRYNSRFNKVKRPSLEDNNNHYSAIMENFYWICRAGERGL